MSARRLRESFAAAAEGSLRVLTQNIWFAEKAWELRAAALVDLIAEARADVVTLQEVRKEVLCDGDSGILSLLKARGLSYACADKSGGSLGSYGVTILVRAPHRIAKSVFTRFPTNLGRNLLSCVVILSADDDENSPGEAKAGEKEADGSAAAAGRAKERKVLVSTAHLESIAGNHKYRRDQLDIAFPAMEEIGAKHGVGTRIMTGDFNFCGTNERENSAIPESWDDAWVVATPADDPDGWTENSDVNRMMFAEKRRRKMVRFDRVLARQDSEFEIQSVRLVGTMPVDDGPDAAEEWDETRIWVSDHFGVCADLKLRGD